MSEPIHTNSLIEETSPYLLQHAHNPVNWLAWGPSALEKAASENKLILISIGYSACHWCHVMEHESFESEEVAVVMNTHFICIKIDREERPDIDQVYMDALQLMTGHGGWPLNCICLPDQRPIYGGTYFRKDDWIALLLNLADYWQKSPAEAVEYAAKLTVGIQQSGEFSAAAAGDTLSRSGYKGFLKRLDGIWMRHIDKVKGGFGAAPKFPLPGSWLFLMRKATLSGDEELLHLVDLTLHRMAYGGIYDQLGGGFSRYSTDANWFAPHFEKMLYDNAQLISLYTEAWQRTGTALYRQVADESLKFIKFELTAPEGGFYAALDADSEGVEGKFYTWSVAEINSLLGSEAELVKTVYHAKEEGNWEHTNILYRDGNESALAARIGLSEQEFQVLLKRCKSRLMIHRSARVRPGLDDKIMTCWNALMVKAYADAWYAFREPAYLEAAQAGAHFLFDKLEVGQQLYRTYKGGVVKIKAFLDDYIFLAEACLALYNADHNQHWIFEAQRLTERALADFYDQDKGMFYYTTADEPLIARKQEVFDTVIPSSSSSAGRVLLYLGTYLGNDRYIQLGERMIGAVSDQMAAYAPSFPNWGLLLLELQEGITEIAVCGPDAEATAAKLAEIYLPFSLIMTEPVSLNRLPLLEGKTGLGINQIFVCKNKTCQLPVTKIEEVITLIGQLRE